MKLGHLDMVKKLGLFNMFTDFFTSWPMESSSSGYSAIDTKVHITAFNGIFFRSNTVVDYSANFVYVLGQISKCTKGLKWNSSDSSSNHYSFGGSSMDFLSNLRQSATIMFHINKSSEITKSQFQATFQIWSMICFHIHTRKCSVKRLLFEFGP